MTTTPIIAPAPLPRESPSFNVQLRLEDASFEASSAKPLIASAQDAGIELLTSCRNGTCRTCLRRLVSGSVSYNIEWPGLSIEEKREGYILPCVAHPASDLVID